MIVTSVPGIDVERIRTIVECLRVCAAVASDDGNAALAADLNENARDLAEAIR